MLRRTLLTAALILGAALPVSAAPQVVAGELRSPESVAWHAQSGTWFISNMGGVSFDLGPDAGKGFITRVSGDGSTSQWITGLDRPRGIAAGPNHLFIAERTGVAIANIATATIVKRWAIAAGNGDLNDIAYDPASDEVFISAPSVGAIFHIKSPLGAIARAEVFVQSPALTQPNGILVEPATLTTVGLGFGSATEGFGKVVSIDRGNKKITPVTATGLGILDGIVKDGDDFLVTEYMTGNLYRVARDGTVLLEMKLLPSSADLGIDPATRTIGVPETLFNAAAFLPLV
ncbi:MAG: hypothetical protein ACLGH3_03560 [Actinomycetota bacterium]